ncbi:hypothetical protein J6590_060782 [Homalodisca vitripennis]|nr:hypothetical protein J6590_060782 [Homalodisca vitripennis]
MRRSGFDNAHLKSGNSVFSEHYACSEVQTSTSQDTTMSGLEPRQFACGIFQSRGVIGVGPNHIIRCGDFFPS